MELFLWWQLAKFDVLEVQELTKLCSFVQVATWNKHMERVFSLLLFGDNIISLDVKGNLFIWAFKGVEGIPEPIGHVQLEEEFSPSCLMHPDTYLNKVRSDTLTSIILFLKIFTAEFFLQVIVGSQEGSLQLWNISTKTKLYEFKGWKSAVHCCVSSPALDVVAVGCANGEVHVHNIRYDEEVMTFSHSTRGAVTALSFRTGGTCYLIFLTYV